MSCEAHARVQGMLNPVPHSMRPPTLGTQPATTNLRQHKGSHACSHTAMKACNTNRHTNLREHERAHQLPVPVVLPLRCHNPLHAVRRVGHVPVVTPLGGHLRGGGGQQRGHVY